MIALSIIFYQLYIYLIIFYQKKLKCQSSK